MHYYSFNIADYRKDTSHLSLLEHGIYRQLLDTYYLDEKPIETQSVIRRLAIKTKEEQTAFENIVNDFFECSECGNFIIHNRVNDEIDKYQKKVETAKANGSKGGRPSKPKKTKPVNSANPEKTKSKANQEPITNNQEPITITIFWVELQKIFNETLGEKLGEIRALTDERKKHVKARIGEDSEKRGDLTWWKNYFEAVAEIPFLIGDGNPNPETGRPWKACFDWLINPNNLIKILEGKYS